MDRELVGAPAMSRRWNLTYYLDADGGERAYEVALVEAELGVGLIERG